jgi:xylulokinase/glycerol kinase
VITSGCVYRWFRDNLAAPGTDEEIVRAGAGAQGVMLLPHFAGAAAPYWDPDASGILFGLALGHTRAHITRAVLEGICFEICKNLHIIERLTGEISEVRVSGGAAKSELFNQIQADVYGKPVLRTVCEESSALGALIVAAAAVGLYPDVPAAVEAIAAFDAATRKTPDPRLCAMYRRALALHDEIYQALRSRGLYEKARELRLLIEQSSPKSQEDVRIGCQSTV